MLIPHQDYLTIREAAPIAGITERALRKRCAKAVVRHTQSKPQPIRDNLKCGTVRVRHCKLTLVHPADLEERDVGISIAECERLTGIPRNTWYSWATEGFPPFKRAIGKEARSKDAAGNVHPMWHVSKRDFQKVRTLLELDRVKRADGVYLTIRGIKNDHGDVSALRPRTKPKPPDQAYETVRPIVEKLRADGMSLRKIAAKLNGRGYKTRTGKPWNHVQLSAYVRGRRTIREVFGVLRKVRKAKAWYLSEDGKLIHGPIFHADDVSRIVRKAADGLLDPNRDRQKAVKAILKALQNGKSIDEAAAEAGVSEATVRRWMDKSKKFARAVKKANNRTKRGPAPIDPWRDRKRAIQTVLEAVEKGMSLVEAATEAGTAFTTVSKWKRQSKEFSRALEAKLASARSEPMESAESNRPIKAHPPLTRHAYEVTDERLGERLDKHTEQTARDAKRTHELLEQIVRELKRADRHDRENGKHLEWMRMRNTPENGLRPSWQQLADRWNNKHPDDPTTAGAVRKAVTRLNGKL